MTDWDRDQLGEPGPIDGKPAPAVVTFEAPGLQRRLTVAFRIILVIPHLFFALAIGLATFVVVIVGWFAALFTGRLPTGIAAFLTQALQYFTRVGAYGQFLFTDRYPPFALGPADYAVDVEVRPGSLNRAAVFFRLILMIPAGIVQTLATGGAYVGLFIAWLILLISGRMPRMLWEALAGVFRYQTRLYAYGLMLTAAYPARLFGDSSEVAEAPIAPPEPEASEPDELPDFLSAGPPRITRLVLSKGAKRLIVVFLILGFATNAGSTAISISEADDIATANALIDEQQDLTEAAQEFSSQSVSCAASIECIRDSRSRFADAFSEFGDVLADRSIPADSRGEAERLQLLTTQIENVLREGDPADTEQLQGLLLGFDDAFNSLIEALQA
jgi:hypothetical protein